MLSVNGMVVLIYALMQMGIPMTTNVLITADVVRTIFTSVA